MTDKTTPNAPQKPRKTKDGPNPVDVLVGGRLRQRRKRLEMSQKELGAKVDLTFQQIQKYESGANRIGAGRLFDFATILEVPIEYFFQGVNTDRTIDPEPNLPADLVALAPAWARLAAHQATAIANVIKASADATSPTH